MLYAKINPPAKTIEQNSMFSGTIKNVEYMSANVRPYSIGSLTYNFEVIFGDITYINNVPSFKRILSKNILLTSNDISIWGTDDTVILQILASKLELSIIEYVTIN